MIFLMFGHFCVLVIVGVVVFAFFCLLLRFGRIGNAVSDDIDQVKPDLLFGGERFACALKLKTKINLIK